MAVCVFVAVSMVPGVLTLNLVRDAMILEDRGVQVAARVVDYRTAGRASDTVTVRPLEPPYFETDLDRWPSGLGVGQQIDVVFDPRNPGLSVGVGASQVNFVTLGVAAFDLLGLAFLLAALLPVGELVRRAWARDRGDRATGDGRLTASRPPRQRRRSPLAGLESGQFVFLLVAAPVSVALSGLLAFNVAGDAAVLRDSGIRAQATVEASSWGVSGNWLDVRFSLPDGTVVSTSLTPRDLVFYEGDTLDVLYQLDSPRNAQVTGDVGWQIQAQIAIGFFIVCAAGSAVAVPAAVINLVQRARRARTASVVSPTAG